ncbi:nuclear RNA export factor 2 [Dasypus novemcinctus]|uniref:nuclear RNA export factor 2 n=1 Tax=Dasypus novemcinctus TaxID=9361 RepID=UPI00062A8A89|nr:nuclear RNA export factor 2 [Dasypus novemcinctus]
MIQEIDIGHLAQDGSNRGEYNDGGCFPQGRKKCQSCFRRDFGKGNLQYDNENGVSELQPSTLQEDDGYMAMRDALEGPQIRHIPYVIRPKNRGVKWNNGDHIRITVWRNRKHSEREVEQNWQDETQGNWFKITVPYGRKYDKTWLLDSIQTHCSVPFIPVDFHYVKNRAQFFVQYANIASALKDVDYKICDEENRKISIFVNQSAAPHSVQNKLNSQQIEQLKLTMYKRYDVFQQALDLQSLRFDPDLVGHDIDMILNRRNCMAATLKIIEEDFPELLSLNLRNNKLYQLDGLSDIIQKAPKVKILNLSKNELKSMWELDKMKSLKLEELWLEGNPLCRSFPDKSTYISFVLKLFPKLSCLDGQELPSPITVGSEVPKIIKPCKESYKGSETLKSLVLQFLQQYFLIYDYEDRQSLLGAYHNEACFSLTTPFKSQVTAPSSLSQYFKVSRNLKKFRDPDLRVQLLKHTKYDIVGSLSVLPKTQHDFGSFVVDMCVQTKTMLCFSVNGVFQEVEGKSQGSVRAFTRTFITTPGSNYSLCIVNEELFVRDASPKETQRAFSIPVPTPSSSCVPSFSQKQQEMVQAFSIQSGMKLEWSLKCLQDNEWNYTTAGQVFIMLKAEGKIPEEAFNRNP